jgi:hypothetical protein
MYVCILLKKCFVVKVYTQALVHKESPEWPAAATETASTTSDARIQGFDIHPATPHVAQGRGSTFGASEPPEAAG